MNCSLHLCLQMDMNENEMNECSQKNPNQTVVTHQRRGGNQKTVLVGFIQRKLSVTSGSLRNQCEIRLWMHFSCTQVIYLKRNRAENVFLVLIFQSRGLLPLYTDVCIAMPANKDSLDRAATCRSQANVVVFTDPGVILQWGEACGSPECPAWGGGCLRNHTIWLREASRHQIQGGAVPLHSSCLWVSWSTGAQGRLSHWLRKDDGFSLPGPPGQWSHL